MSDRQQLLVYAVAAALLVFLLFRLVQPHLRRGIGGVRWPARGDVRRWFVRGRRATEPLLPVFIAVAAGLVLVGTWHAWRDSRVERAWVAHNPSAAAPPFQKQTVDNLLKRLPNRILTGWQYLIPSSSAWAFGMWVLLWNARKRSRFPFSSRPSEAGSAWIALTALGGVFWIVGIADFLTHDPFDPSRLKLFSAPALVAWGEALLLGLGFLVPPLMASADERTDEYIAHKHAARNAYFRLMLIQLLPWIPGLLASILWLLVSEPAGFGPGSRISRGDASRLLLSAERMIGSVQQPAEFLLGVFCWTASLWACSAPSLGRTMRDNLHWWRREGPFLLLLALGAGTATALFSSTVRLLLGDSQRFLHRILTGIAIAEVNFAISVLTFSLLLGNWLEARGEPRLEPPLS